MGFLDKDTKKALEGKYIKWEDGEARTLKLLSNEVVTKNFNGEERRAIEITAQDEETGEEKVFTPNRNFLKALGKLDDQLSPGSVVRIVPMSQTFATREGGEGRTFDFDITLSAADADFS